MAKEENILYKTANILEIIINNTIQSKLSKEQNFNEKNLS
jgi:hypothetical protein